MRELCSRWAEFCGHLLSCLGKSLRTHLQSFLAHTRSHGRGWVLLKQFRSYIISNPFLCQSLHPVEMPKSPHRCRMSISTNLRDPGAVIWQRQVQRARKSPLPLWFHHCSLLSLPVPLFGFPFPPKFCILPELDWICGIQKRSVLKLTFLPKMPTHNVLVGTGILTLLFTSTVFNANWLSASSDGGVNFTSNLLVRDQTPTVQGKMLFQLAWNEGVKCSCLDVSSRAAVVVPLDVFLLYRRTISSYLSNPAHRFETRIRRRSALRFLPLRGSQRRTKRCSAPRMMSKLSLSVKTKSANMDLFALFQNIVNWFFTQRQDPWCRQDSGVQMIVCLHWPVLVSQHFSVVSRQSKSLSLGSRHVVVLATYCVAPIYCILYSKKYFSIMDSVM